MTHGSPTADERLDEEIEQAEKKLRAALDGHTAFRDHYGIDYESLDSATIENWATDPPDHEHGILVAAGFLEGLTVARWILREDDHPTDGQ